MGIEGFFDFGEGTAGFGPVDGDRGERVLEMGLRVVVEDFFCG